MLSVTKTTAWMHRDTEVATVIPKCSRKWLKRSESWIPRNPNRLLILSACWGDIIWKDRVDQCKFRFKQIINQPNNNFNSYSAFMELSCFNWNWSFIKALFWSSDCQMTQTDTVWLASYLLCATVNPIEVCIILHTGNDGRKWLLIWVGTCERHILPNSIWCVLITDHLATTRWRSWVTTWWSCTHDPAYCQRVKQNKGQINEKTIYFPNAIQYIHAPCTAEHVRLLGWQLLEPTKYTQIRLSL